MAACFAVNATPTTGVVSSTLRRIAALLTLSKGSYQGLL